MSTLQKLRQRLIAQLYSSLKAVTHRCVANNIAARNAAFSAGEAFLHHPLYGFCDQTLRLDVDLMKIGLTDGSFKEAEEFGRALRKEANGFFPDREAKVMLDLTLADINLAKAQYNAETLQAIMPDFYHK